MPPPLHLMLIHQMFLSHTDAGGTRHFELGTRLQGEGHRLTVVASDIEYLTGRQLVGKRKLVGHDDVNGISVLRCWTYAGVQKTFIGRLIAFLSFMVTSVIAAIGVSKVDIVWGTTPPIFQCLSAWLVAAVKRKTFLLEVRDLWPEFAIDAGLLKNPVVIWIARRVEDFLYARADHIVINSPAYRTYLAERGVSEGRISLIANGVDSSMFHPDARGDALRSEFGIGDRFLVLYAGAMGMMNDLSTMVAAADILRHRSDIAFMIVGDGKERENIRTQVERKQLTNFILAGAQPKGRMPDFLAAADCGLASLLPIRSMMMTYPNKVFDYMAAGRPTVLAIDGVIRKVIDDARGGLFAPPGDPVAMARAISQLADDRAAARQMGTNARAYVETFFNRDAQARQFLELVQRLARH